MKKILMLNVIGQYDVFQIFQQELCQGWRGEGYEVDIYDIKNDRMMRELAAWPFFQYEFIFSLNGALMDWIGPYLPAATVAVALIVDHPVYQNERIGNSRCLNLIGLHVDQYRTDFAARFYPHVRKNIFLPHGGSGGGEEKPYREREFDIVQLGGYSDPEKLMARILEEHGQIKDFVLDVVGTFLQEETISIEMAIRLVCTKRGLCPSEQQIFEYVNSFQLEDMFIRSYDRDLAVRALLQSGQDVHVFGNGWDEFRGENMDRLHIHGSVSYEEALKVMGNARIVLNVTPSLNYGSHERIFSSMLNGAVCLTNKSLYFPEAGLSSLLVEFSLNNIKDLQEKAFWLLNNPGQAERLAQNARKEALRNHQWGNRAGEIIRIAEEYKAGLGCKKSSYANDVDMEFGEWSTFVTGSTRDMLFAQMQNNFCLNQAGEVFQMLRSYNHYGFWGRCEPEKGNYELLDNRIHEIKGNQEEIRRLYRELSDFRSKYILNSIMRHWLDYSKMHLGGIVEAVYSQYFDLDLISCTDSEVFIDLGAFHGETSREFIRIFGAYKRIYCYEMFEENMAVCKDSLGQYPDIVYRQCAVGASGGKTYISVDEDISACTVGNTGAKCTMVTLDEDVQEPITFLKMDIEGSEYDALAGAEKHIKNDHPKLAIACYHGNQDIWRLAGLIREIEGGYRFYLRYYGGVLYPSEYVLYGICLEQA